MVAVGTAFTDTVVAADVTEHPLALDTVTVKFPLVVTEILEAVDPLLHKYELPALAVNVTEPPEQKVVDPLAEIVAAGVGLTVTEVAVDVAEHPLPLFTVTV